MPLGTASPQEKLIYAAQMIASFAKQLETGKPFDGDACEKFFGVSRACDTESTLEAIEHWTRKARETLTRTLAADTATGVYDVDKIPDGRHDHGDTFVDELRGLKDGEIIYAVVSGSAADKIQAEYGIRR